MRVGSFFITFCISSYHRTASLHSTFGRDPTRKIAHRWRPIPIQLPDAPQVVAKSASVNMYARTIIELESPNAFGLVEFSDSDHMSLFVVRGQNASTYVITSYLSTYSDSIDVVHAIERASLWYMATFDAKLKTHSSVIVDKKNHTDDGDEEEPEF